MSMLFFLKIFFLIVNPLIHLILIKTSIAPIISFFLGSQSKFLYFILNFSIQIKTEMKHFLIYFFLHFLLYDFLRYIYLRPKICQCTLIFIISCSLKHRKKPYSAHKSCTGNFQILSSVFHSNFMVCCS